MYYHFLCASNAVIVQCTTLIKEGLLNTGKGKEITDLTADCITRGREKGGAETNSHRNTYRPKEEGGVCRSVLVVVGNTASS